MHQNTTPGTSRRTFLAAGLSSTVGFVGLSSADRDAESDPSAERTHSKDADGEIGRGVMRPYQHIPERQVTVETALDWTPQRLGESYRAYVVRYDHAPSYRASLFTEMDDTDEANAEERRSHTLESGDSLRLGSRRGSPSPASRRYITVDLERGERDA